MESNINELPKEVLDKIEAKYTKIWYAGTDKEWKQQLPCRDAAIFGYSLSQSTIQELQKEVETLKGVRDSLGKNIEAEMANHQKVSEMCEAKEAAIQELCGVLADINFQLAALADTLHGAEDILVSKIRKVIDEATSKTFK